MKTFKTHKCYININYFNSLRVVLIFKLKHGEVK